MKHILYSADGAKAEIALNGAHVTSWIPQEVGEQLFLSQNSDVKAGASIRGGVPVIFPQFAALGNLPKHGFARNQLWHLRQSDQPDRAVFELRDNDETRAIWPHAFLAEITVAISGLALEVELAVTNTGTTPFDFTAALHTYLRVDDIAATRLLGLQGTTYRDSATCTNGCVEKDDECAIVGQVDRIYFNAPNMLTVKRNNHSILVQSIGFPDAVVWNPGPELSAAMADMEPQGYQRMLCVEAANIGNPVVLQSGQRWSAAQRLLVSK